MTGGSGATQAARVTSTLWGRTGSGQALVPNPQAHLQLQKQNLHASQERGHLLQAPPTNNNSRVLGTRQLGCVITCHVLTCASSLSPDSHPGGCVHFRSKDVGLRGVRQLPYFHTAGKQWGRAITRVPHGLGPRVAWRQEPWVVWAPPLTCHWWVTMAVQVLLSSGSSCTKLQTRGKASMRSHIKWLQTVEYHPNLRFQFKCGSLDRSFVMRAKTCLPPPWDITPRDRSELLLSLRAAGTPTRKSSFLWPHSRPPASAPRR